jgi:hypothetical protein
MELEDRSPRLGGVSPGRHSRYPRQPAVRPGRDEVPWMAFDDPNDDRRSKNPTLASNLFGASPCNEQRGEIRSCDGIRSSPQSFWPTAPGCSAKDDAVEVSRDDSAVITTMARAPPASGDAAGKHPVHSMDTKSDDSLLATHVWADHACSSALRAFCGSLSKPGPISCYCHRTLAVLSEPRVAFARKN